MEDRPTLTWMQRRELERELWLDEHLRALAAVEPEDLDDPAALRAIETRARELAAVVAGLRAQRGDDLAIEREVRALNEALDA